MEMENETISLVFKGETQKFEHRVGKSTQVQAPVVRAQASRFICYARKVARLSPNNKGLGLTFPRRRRGYCHLDRRVYKDLQTGKYANRQTLGEVNRQFIGFKGPE